MYTVHRHGDVSVKMYGRFRVQIRRPLVIFLVLLFLNEPTTAPVISKFKNIFENKHSSFQRKKNVACQINEELGSGKARTLNAKSQSFKPA